MILTKENYEVWSDSFSKELIKKFGKDTFSEMELTKDFYVEIKISFSNFFMSENDVFDLDLFWSEELKLWLLSKDKKIFPVINNK